MSCYPPSTEDLKARFPEFAVVNDTLCSLILAEAASQVGVCWLDRDRNTAILLLAAHNLSMEGEPGRTTTGAGTAGTGSMTSRKVGDVQVTFSGGSSASGFASYAGYGGSEYGRRFADLMRKNFPAIRVV